MIWRNCSQCGEPYPKKFMFFKLGLGLICRYCWDSNVQKLISRFQRRQSVNVESKLVSESTTNPPLPTSFSSLPFFPPGGGAKTLLFVPPPTHHNRHGRGIVDMGGQVR